MVRVDQSALAVAQPAYGGCQVVAHLLGELSLLIQEVVFQEVTEMTLYACRIQGMKTQKGLVQVLLQGQVTFHGLLGFTLLILRWPLHILEKCMTLPSVCNLSPYTLANSQKLSTPSRFTSSQSK